MKAREVDNFPDRGNHIGDLIKLPSGQIYKWSGFKRWTRVYNEQ
jgi:hypothetical protein